MEQVKFNKVELPRDRAARKIGMGRALAGSDKDARRKSFVGMARQAMKCPTYNLETIESVTVNYPGALTTANVGANFGATINPLAASPESPPAGASEVFSTMAEPGKFQTYTLICAIQWRFDVEPVMFSCKGNSFTAPTVGQAKPVSPDFFSATPNDSAALGALGLAAGQTMRPAVLEWAWWAAEAFYYMTRGYNLQWQYGNLVNWLNDSLRYTAYLPSGAQADSASSSEIDVDFYIRRLNAYYRSIGSTDIFLSLDRTRLGNQSLGGTAGLSVFHPSRAYETVGGTYGGGGLRQMIRGNTEFRRLPTVVVVAPGVPLGFKAQVQSSTDQALMQAFLDASYAYAPAGVGGGVVPASFTDDANISVGAAIAGTGGTTGVEPSLDSPSVANSIQPFAERRIFKGGPYSLTVAFKGFELSPDQIDLLRDPATRDQVQSELGIQFSRFGW